MKCARCHNEAPVLTPSPQGDQELCSDCYAEVYREMTSSKHLPKGLLAGTFLTAALAVAGIYVVVSKPDGNEAKEPPPEGGASSLLTGPNKPDRDRIQRIKKRHRRRRSKNISARSPSGTSGKSLEEPEPKEEATDGEEAGTEQKEAAISPGAEKSGPDSATQTDSTDNETAGSKAAAGTPEKTGTGAGDTATTGSETEPAEPESEETPDKPEVIETDNFKLRLVSLRPVAAQTVHVVPQEDGVTSEIRPENAFLYQVSITLRPPGEAGYGAAGYDFDLTGISVLSGGQQAAPLHARVKGSSYLVPSRSASVLAENPAIIIKTGMDQDWTDFTHSDMAIEEIVFNLRGDPGSVSVDLLFALPGKPGPGAVLAFANQNIPLSGSE